MQILKAIFIEIKFDIKVNISNFSKIQIWVFIIYIFLNIGLKRKTSL